MRRAIVVVLLMLPLLAMFGRHTSPVAVYVPPAQGTRPSDDFPKGTIMLWYEDETIEDCEANGTYNEQTHKYDGWPSDCEDVYAPALFHSTTQAVCERLQHEYAARENDSANAWRLRNNPNIYPSTNYFKCSDTNPSHQIDDRGPH